VQEILRGFMVGRYGRQKESDFKDERKELIKSLKFHNISDRVLSAMERVPRHLFVPETMGHRAYVDSPLSIGKNQTISAPHMVAIMCDALDLCEGLKVLEIGAGSGYHAAVISELIGGSGRVYTIERIEELAESASNNLKKAGYNNIEVIVADGTLGFSKYAPYDRISVTCAAPDVPPPLLDQLKIGGKMAIPIGKSTQYLHIIDKIEKDGKVKQERKMGVVFVPLVGKYGF